MSTDYFEKVRRLHKVEKTDFIIVSKPAYITFDCPYCGCKAEVLWRNVNEPEYCGDD